MYLFRALQEKSSQTEICKVCLYSRELILQQDFQMRERIVFFYSPASLSLREQVLGRTYKHQK